MQVLLQEQDKLFKTTVQNFTSNYFKENKQINLKNFWQSLYKESFISKENSLLKNVLLIQAICKVNPGIGLFFLTQFNSCEIIKKFANDNLKNKYLNKLISGEMIACFSITEPNAGSDVSMIETSAKKENNSWILNGHKIWASNASISDLIITFAQTKSYRDKTGVTCFIIPSKTKEIEILKDTPKLGVKITPSNEVLIKNLEISSENQIGDIGDGIKIALSTITFGRIYCTAQAVGLLEGILEESIKHSIKRNQFGKPISENQAIQWYIADMAKDLDASKLLLYKAAWVKENQVQDLNKLSSMAKYFSTSACQKHSTIAVQILGGQGLYENSYVANAYKDSKVLEIYEGTNEIQKLVIAKEIL
ncbi:MAG: acyl-CoA dehydrogenase family protein [Candidatus Melainabacteria bacterium]|nr:acyl-CoA dehydrogenase family protein [Candidatus Melainabacteria bacterium]